ncbi:GNAT family N-acetyltransferase [Portibacter lacus]|uniref:N-acetyltransferase n=1 Tax=Portibacter lacus TaxID=1099794 RepID=A0AA37SNK7_9BACT|nr:GNAT family N-acetyltransferase [Portibacter lacus]GLR18068.1 N-acetyltransferase [Portibacter lacus]
MLTISDNRSLNRFEYKQGEHLAIIDYTLKNDKIYLMHTEVPEALGGQGIGSGLVKAVLQNIKDRGLKLVPLCPFVVSYLKRHPEEG